MPIKDWRTPLRTLSWLRRLSWLRTSIHQGESNLHCDEYVEDNIHPLDPRVQKQIRTYLEVFGELPTPAFCDKLVQMHLKLKPGIQDTSVALPGS